MEPHDGLGSRRVSDVHPRIAAMPNFRDLGGRRTADGGLVRSGLLFRSDVIGPLTPADEATLARIGLRMVYDLRTDDERQMMPGSRIAGATHVTLDVMADEDQSMAAQIMRAISDPGAVQGLLGGGRGVAMFIESYVSFVRLDSARAGLGSLYRAISDADRLPALFHCTTGKDRTGWASAALLTLLGVPQEEVMADFLESNRHILAKFRPHLQDFAARGGDPELLAPVLEVRPEYLEASFAEVRRLYGSVEGYFERGLGLDASAQQALHDRLVTRVPGVASCQ